MKTISIEQLAHTQRAFFETHRTQEISYRIKQLKTLKALITRNEDRIISAIQNDLGKPTLDAYFSAIHLCSTEIDYALANVQHWTKKQYVKTPLSLWPMRSAVQAQPYGTTLIISTWNYPFNLNVLPLIGAITAGNCAVLKPSHRARHSQELLADLINNQFDSRYIYVASGGPDVADALIAQQWDSIFLTGSPAFAKKVLQHAAEYTTPVSLELGGKSPCIVDTTASIDLAAKKIVWGKFLNAGQNCISPDYLLVHKDIKDPLIRAMKKYIHLFFGDDPQNSLAYSRIIDRQHLERLESFLRNATIIHGGTIDKDDNYLAPTLLEVASLEHPIMHEEIFGPLLPIVSFSHIDEALALYRRNPQPLALYLFSHDKTLQNRVQTETASGAFGINELVLQVCSHYLPFGGIGRSGMGRYHGKASFDTFSNQRACIESRWPELPFRYPNYPKTQAFFKKLLGWLR